MSRYYLDLFSGIGGFALGAEWAGQVADKSVGKCGSPANSGIALAADCGSARRKKMKYYCENCGNLLETKWEQIVCPVCVANQLYESLPTTYEAISSGYDKYIREVPDHETVAQWEARTGKQYPENAPVYSATAGNWRCIGFYGGATIGAKDRLVVATSAGAPPDDWRPEEADFPQSEVVGNIHDDPDLLKKEY
jgi:DNA-directed RNA polymerase subunit RPC12/RpoP